MIHSYQSQSLTPKPIEKFKHRQAKNCRMISFDPIKQIYSDPFDLIAADAGKNCVTSEIKIARYFARIERTHV